MQVTMRHLQHAVARLGDENARLAAQAAATRPGDTAGEPAGQLGGSGAAQEEEQGALSMQQLRAERRLLKGITKLALAIATDALTGQNLTTRSVIVGLVLLVDVMDCAWKC